MPKCKNPDCGKKYEKKSNGIVSWCSVECAYIIARIKQDEANKRKIAKLGKDIKKKESAERAELRKRKQAIKTNTELAKEAQAACNAYIRLRDYGQTCISCGNPMQHHLPNKVDAGHYRSVGAAKHIRFYTLNIHAQCKVCNNHKSGNQLEYRIKLIKKLGVDKVEEIEHNNEVRRYTRDYLVRIKQLFRKKHRQLKRRRGYD